MTLLLLQTNVGKEVGRRMITVRREIAFGHQQHTGAVPYMAASVAQFHLDIDSCLLENVNIVDNINTQYFVRDNSRKAMCGTR